MKTKVTYIISNINKAISFEWTAELINKEKIELSFILLNPGETELEKYLLKNGYLVKRINYKNKFDIPKALLYTIIFIMKQKPAVLHAHLFDANIVGLLAAWICRVKKRIYTRHHSSYHHDYFPKAVKYDKLCNYLSTKIIATTIIVKEILEEKEFVPSNKIQLIHHGFKLENFSDVSNELIQSLKQKYSTQNSYPVIGVISRYTEWKGIQFIIPAFKKILKKYPNAKLVLANAHGDYAFEIKELLKDISTENYIEINFENNAFALYKLFDVFVHVPINKYAEAFGQIYVEALAASIPSVFTISGIANEFIKDKHNALVVNYKDSESIYLAINEIINNKELTTQLIKNGKKNVLELFSISKMIADLELLYLEAGNAK